MTDLIREIEQEAQQDAVQQFIKKNVFAIVGGITVAVLVAAGYLWWQNAQERRALADAETYGAALQSFQSGDLDQGQQTLATLENTSSGYAVLARFESAKQSADAGNLDTAINQWDAIYGDQNFAPQYRNLAAMFKAMALTGAERWDDALTAALAVDPTSVGFGPKAKELQGLIKWQSGDTAGALAEFLALKELLATDQFGASNGISVAETDVDSYIEQLTALQ